MPSAVKHVRRAMTQRPLYLDHKAPFEARAKDLVERMTVEEKISQMLHAAPAIARLGIPAYNWWNECLHSVARAGKATVFPQAIGMAAAWSPAHSKSTRAAGSRALNSGADRRCSKRGLKCDFSCRARKNVIPRRDENDSRGGGGHKILAPKIFSASLI